MPAPSSLISRLTLAQRAFVVGKEWPGERVSFQLASEALARFQKNPDVAPTFWQRLQEKVLLKWSIHSSGSRLPGMTERDLPLLLKATVQESERFATTNQKLQALRVARGEDPARLASLDQTMVERAFEAGFLSHPWTVNTHLLSPEPAWSTGGEDPLNVNMGYRPTGRIERVFSTSSPVWERQMVLFHEAGHSEHAFRGDLFDHPHLSRSDNALLNRQLFPADRSGGWEASAPARLLKEMVADGMSAIMLGQLHGATPEYLAFLGEVRNARRGDGKGALQRFRCTRTDSPAAVLEFLATHPHQTEVFLARLIEDAPRWQSLSAAEVFGFVRQQASITCLDYLHAATFEHQDSSVPLSAWKALETTASAKARQSIHASDVWAAIQNGLTHRLRRMAQDDAGLHHAPASAGLGFEEALGTLAPVVDRILGQVRMENPDIWSTLMEVESGLRGHPLPSLWRLHLATLTVLRDKSSATLTEAFDAMGEPQAWKDIEARYRTRQEADRQAMVGFLAHFKPASVSTQTPPFVPAFPLTPARVTAALLASREALGHTGIPSAPPVSSTHPPKP
jgi:hypothetical protein